jgi:translation initiation factor IF-1
MYDFGNPAARRDFFSDTDSRTGERLSEKEAAIEVQGRVEDSSGGMYRVKIDQGPVVLAYPSGKMKRFRIRIITGDRVKVELSPYDLTRGRITYRDK